MVIYQEKVLPLLLCFACRFSFFSEIVFPQCPDTANTIKKTKNKLHVFILSSIKTNSHQFRKLLSCKCFVTDAIKVKVESTTAQILTQIYHGQMNIQEYYLLLPPMISTKDDISATTNTQVNERRPRSPCKFKCSINIAEDVRQQYFVNYWALISMTSPLLRLSLLSLDINIMSMTANAGIMVFYFRRKFESAKHFSSLLWM